MAEIMDVTRVVSDGYHNAFTDLIHWQGAYYLAFRKAEHHGISPPGDVVILRSRDLSSWTPCALISSGADDRDPKLIDGGDVLGVVFGSWFPRWGQGSIANAPHDLISQVCVSRDGLAWSSPRQVYGVNYWLWRILASRNDGFFCAAYHFPVRGNRIERSVHLLRGDDLFEWHLEGLMRAGDGPGEPVLWQPEKDTLHCVIRRGAEDQHSWFGRSREPYHDWEWHDMGVMIHAPVVIEANGQWLVAGRSRPADLPAGTVALDSGAHTSIWRLISDDGQVDHVATAPSGGDCSYCGFAKSANGDILMSYYSQHEWLPLDGRQPTPADVFIARVRL